MNASISDRVKRVVNLLLQLFVVLKPSLFSSSKQLQLQPEPLPQMQPSEPTPSPKPKRRESPSSRGSVSAGSQQKSASKRSAPKAKRVR
jgi:energy-converting hydrogenase Eha subunit F